MASSIEELQEEHYNDPILFLPKDVLFQPLYDVWVEGNQLADKLNTTYSSRIHIAINYDAFHKLLEQALIEHIKGQIVCLLSILLFPTYKGLQDLESLANVPCLVAFFQEPF